MVHRATQPPPCPITAHTSAFQKGRLKLKGKIQSSTVNARVMKFKSDNISHSANQENRRTEKSIRFMI